MSFDAQAIYELLPAIYRTRDAEQGGALRQLIGVIAEQVAVLEEDIEQLYDNQFIETCAPWAACASVKDTAGAGAALGAPSAAEAASVPAADRAMTGRRYRRMVITPSGQGPER